MKRKKKKKKTKTSELLFLWDRSLVLGIDISYNLTKRSPIADPFDVLRRRISSNFKEAHEHVHHTVPTPPRTVGVIKVLC